MYVELLHDPLNLGGELVTQARGARRTDSLHRGYSLSVESSRGMLAMCCSDEDQSCML